MCTQYRPAPERTYFAQETIVIGVFFVSVWLWFLEKPRKRDYYPTDLVSTYGPGTWPDHKVTKRTAPKTHLMDATTPLGTGRIDEPSVLLAVTNLFLWASTTNLKLWQC